MYLASTLRNHLTNLILKNFRIQNMYVFKIKFNLNALKKYNGEFTKFQVVEKPNLNLDADIICIFIISNNF